MEYRRISSLSDVTGKGKSKRKENENETKNSNVNSKKISPTVRYVSPYFHYDRDTNIIVITKRKENENDTSTETETRTAVRYVSPYFRNESDNNIIVLPKKKNENETETSTAVRYVSRFFHNNSKKNINVIVVDKKRKTLSTSEMSKDAYKRKAADNTWMPPKSPHQLLQEYHAHDPWRVLVICMFLNVTCGPQVRSVLSSFFNLCPDAISCTQVATEDIEHVINNLGLQKKRSVMLKRLSEEYLDESWTHVTQLHGVGKYAADAYAIFCTGKWDQVKPSDKVLNLYWDWLNSRKQTL